jgi:hypothetical protein
MWANTTLPDSAFQSTAQRIAEAADAECVALDRAEQEWLEAAERLENLTRPIAALMARNQAFWARQRFEMGPNSPACSESWQ